MPVFRTVNGVKISVFSRDHLPPHAHAEYNEHEALIQIEDLEIYEGWLPSKQYRIAATVVERNREILLRLFFQLNPQIKER